MLNVIIPMIGAIMGAAGTVWERKILKKKGINTKLYLSAGFLGVVLAMLPFVILGIIFNIEFFWSINSQAFTSLNLFIFFLIILFSIIANLFVLYSMKWAKLSNIEPARMLEPLLVILIAIIFSFFIDSGLYEKDMKVVIPALIAGAAILFSHIKKHHFQFSKYFIAAILGSLFFAIELVMTRILLEFYSPLTFYFIRCVIIAVFGIFIFKPDFSKLKTKTRVHIFIIGAIWFVFRVLVYYGYLHFGVIFTTLLIMLMPIFIYTFAWKFLKDKITWKNIVASIIIVLCILYVTVF